MPKCIHAVYRPEEDVGSLRTGVRLLGAAMWVLGTNPRSSTRAASTLNHLPRAMTHFKELTIWMQWFPHSTEKCSGQMAEAREYSHASVDCLDSMISTSLGK